MARLEQSSKIQAVKSWDSRSEWKHAGYREVTFFCTALVNKDT